MTPLQASGAIRTYSERRLRMSVFALHLVDDDKDGAPVEGPSITDDQVADINAKIKELHASKRKLLAYLNVDALEDLPASQFASAVSVLERYRSQA